MEGFDSPLLFFKFTRDGVFMYKFFGKPNQIVKSHIGNVVFRFDDKGIFYTDNETLIERIKKAYDYIECEKPVTIGKRVTVAEKEKPLTITVTVTED
jgi:hypothetical protein